MHDCVYKLLFDGGEESLERVCMLFFVAGKDLDCDKAKVINFVIYGLNW